ncbi:MAG: antibiotic biosynthesis monooxygenase family protein [Planctomycetota bacterium]
MIILFTTYRTKKGHDPKLLEQLTLWLREMAKTPGFLGADLLRDTDLKATYALYTRWQSQQALEDFTSSREEELARRTQIDSLVEAKLVHTFEELEVS